MDSELKNEYVVEADADYLAIKIHILRTSHKDFIDQLIKECNENGFFWGIDDKEIFDVYAWCSTLLVSEI